MATTISLWGDGIKMPIIDQPSPFFFTFPREIRLIIYEFVFADGNPLISNTTTLCPLLTCRQFYMESRKIAFGSVTFRFFWRDIAHKYFDGDLDTFFNQFRICKPITPADNRHYLLGTGEGQDLLSTRHSSGFKIHAMAERAGLSAGHFGALRRISIICFRYDPPNENMRLLGHFLDNFVDLFPKDLQLDLITISFPWDAQDFPALFYLFSPEIRPLWLARAVKRIIFTNCDNPKPAWLNWKVARHIKQMTKPIPRAYDKNKVFHGQDAFRRITELSDPDVDWHWIGRRAPNELNKFSDVEIFRLSEEKARSAARPR
jgi:hypothetical protein